MKGLCEYVAEASMIWGGGMWTGGESAVYADYVEAAIHEDQLEPDNISMTSTSLCSRRMASAASAGLPGGWDNARPH